MISGYSGQVIELMARDACCVFTTRQTLTIIIMSYERRRRRRGEIAVLGLSITTLNTAQTTTNTMTTGEKLQSLQTRSLRPPSSNLAKWFVLPCPRLADLTVMAGRRAGASSTCRQTTFSGATQCPHNCRRFSLGVCSSPFFNPNLCLFSDSV